MKRDKPENPQIVYSDSGRGIPVVMIHGHPFDRSMWHPQVAALQNNYRMITFDLRGYGESNETSAVTDFSDFASDLLSLLDHLEIPSAVVMGLSMGGQIALETWYQARERVLALILADTFSGLDSPQNKQLRYDTANRVLIDGMDSYAEELLPRMVAPQTLSGNARVVRHVSDMMKNTPPWGAAAALRSRAERRDYTPYLTEIDIPVQIIVGAEDEFTPVADALFMHERIRNSNCAVIDGTGHLPNLEDPEKFNAIVKTFLETLLS